MATNLINRQGVVIQQSKLLDQYLEQHAEVADDLGAGILPSFPVLSIRSGKFRIKFHGEETLVTDDRGYPRPDIDVVVINSPRHKSKAYYPEGFDEANASVPPTCWSSDGKVPDDTVPQEQLQNDVCATCQWDKIGSAITNNNKKTKACGDHKRLVVVPSGDILNEKFGGVMLLRVPASSLKNLQAYGDYLKSNRTLYFGVATTLTFDADASYPQLHFNYARSLDDTEIGMVLEARESDQVRRILNEEVAVTDVSTAEPNADDAGEQEGEQVTPESKPASVAQPAQVQPQNVQRQVAQPNVAQPAIRVVPQASRMAPQPVPAQQAGRVAPTPVKPAPAPALQAGRPGAAFGVRQPGNPTIVAAGTGAQRAPGATPVKSTIPPRTTPGTIAGAVARPAVAPASTRTVAQQTAQQVAQPQVESELGVEAAPEEDIEGALPDELNSAFGNLMGNT